MADQRDYSRTGAQDGSGVNYITIIAKNDDPSFGKFVIGGKENRKVLGDNLACFLDSVSMEYKDDNTEKRTKAGWVMLLNIETRIGDEVGKYAIPIHSSWSNPIFANIVNGLAGAMRDFAGWKNPVNRFIRLWVRGVHKPGKTPYASCSIYGSENKGDYLPSAYPFNEGLNSYEGVPSDLDEAMKFWVKLAASLVEKTGGLFIKEQNAPEKISSASYSAVQPPAPTAQAATNPSPATPATPATMTKDQFLEIVESKYMTGSTPEALLAGLVSSLGGFAKYQPAGLKSTDIINKFSQRIGQVIPGAAFVMKGNQPVYLAPAVPSSDPIGDDLPF